MKKYFKLILVIVGLFLLGNKNVYADSYWNDYFQGIELPAGGRISEWENANKKYEIIYGGKGSVCGNSFCPQYYNRGTIYDNVTNVTAVSSKQNVTTEIKPYDFSREKKDFEDYLKFYDNLTLDEVNEGREENNKYTQKPTWWEYNDYQTEPTTWWQAYEYDHEPTNAVEVVYKAKDLGRDTITLSADGKSNITINWTIIAYDVFNEYNSNNASMRLAEILNNLDKYQEVIPQTNEVRDYNFSYYIDNEDLSDTINALKGKDITVNFIQNSTNGITSYYKLNGKDITNTVKKGFTYSHNISMETSINKDKIDNLVDLKDALYIDFTYHGVLPAPYSMTIDIRDYISNKYWNIYREEYDQCSDAACRNRINTKINEEITKYFKDRKFTLLYYNPDTNKMEIIKEGLVTNENGKLDITFDHFSSYVIVPADSYHILSNPRTSNTNIITYIFISCISSIGIIYLLRQMKKQKNN